jgi:beta-1,4-mannosyltransferase
VDLIGYSGSQPCDEVLKHPNIRLCLLPELEIPKYFSSFFLRSVYKTIVQLWVLFSLLMFKIPRPSYILCQNPPAIPLLAIALIVSIFRRSKFVIDWHNYGYTWMAVNRPGSSLLVGFYRIYEKIFGKLANNALCVSKAMKEDLSKNWGINAHVLHDLPQKFFKRTSRIDQAALFNRHAWGKLENGENAFFLPNGSQRQDRPVLLVSSTSWTADEDFSVLLDAVAACDARATKEKKQFPPVRFVVTGKGDLQAFYQQKISELKLSHFTFYTEFLSYADYAKLLGSADLGVSLHFSSSKLDLPMKVVDMFGSELPVIAYDYGCLSELVQNGKNGFTFTNTQQLADILYENVSKLPSDTTTIDRFRQEIQTFKKTKWEDTWAQAALPIFGCIEEKRPEQASPSAVISEASKSPKSPASPKGNRARNVTKK